MDEQSATTKTEPFPSLEPILTSREAVRVENASENKQEALPALETAETRPDASSSDAAGTFGPVRTRRTRGSSLVQSFTTSNPPLGMWQATGELGSKAPTLAEIHNGSFTAQGWSHEGQSEARNQRPHEIHERRVRRASSASAGTGRTRSTRGTTNSPGDATLIRQTLHEENIPRVSTDQMDGASLSAHAISKRGTLSASTWKPPATQRPLDEKRDVLANLNQTTASSSAPPKGPDETGTYPNGYRFPKKHTWSQSMAIGAKAFWRFFITIPGFLITLYGLNVVAWGAMIFFVLIPGATPAMCHPDCEADNSARKIWIEIDSQILNALFCVTGFGLLPWRLRDFYWLSQWRIFGKHEAHRKLAGIYRGWYRLPGSQVLPEEMGPPPTEKQLRKTRKLAAKKRTGDITPETDEEAGVPFYTRVQIAALEANPAIPLPPSMMPDPPLTGVRAPTTRSWTLDMVIWMYILNSALQACLAGFMWGLNRFNRPSWATGFFITAGCLTGIFAGIVVFKEGGRVKKIEGIPIKEYDELESVDDFHERRQKEEDKARKKEEKKEKRDKVKDIVRG